MGRADQALRGWLNDGMGHFAQRELSSVVVYGAICSGILVVVVLGALGWWLVRRPIVRRKRE